MISAAEALRLPSAQLTEEESRAVETLLAGIDARIRSDYTRGTLQCGIREIRTKVVDEVQRRLRKAGWHLVTYPMQEESTISRQKRIVGYGLELSPTEAAYEAAEILASA